MTADGGGVIWTAAILSAALYRYSVSDRQDFSEVAKSARFVDKTTFIRDFLDEPVPVQSGSGPNVKVITGPRRCGKSTIVDMTRRFVGRQVYAADGRPVDAGRNTNRRLFCGRPPLAICRNDDDAFVRQHFGRHPVVHVSFAPLKNVTDLKTYRRAMSEILRQSYSKHGYFLNEEVTPALYSATKQAFRKIAARRLAVAVDEAKYLARLAELVAGGGGGGVVLLLDDYDALGGRRQSFDSADHYERAVASVNRLIRSLLEPNGRVAHALVTGERCVRHAGLSPSLARFAEYRFVGHSNSSRYRGFVKTIKIDAT